MSALPRGQCPVCGADVALRKGALVREHTDARPGRKVTCSGSGHPAVGTADREELERRDDQAVVDRARQVDHQVRTGTRATRTALIMLGGYVYECREQRFWELLDYRSWEEWLADPEIDLRPSTGQALAQVHRELVVERQVPVELLEGLDVRKAQMVLPAIRDGLVDKEQAIADAKTLGRGDLAEKYTGDRGPDAPIDAEAEPERKPCPTCGSWVEVEKLEEREEVRA